MFCGLRWQLTKKSEFGDPVDIDASCVKFSRTGKMLGAVYFVEEYDEANQIRHSGDQIAGPDFDSPRKPRKGEEDIMDCEKITFKLSKVQPNVHVLFFVITIFTAGINNFKEVHECSVRLVDSTEDREYCMFTKKDMLTGNAVVAAMLFRKGDKWCFKAIDQCENIPEHSTYRLLEPQLTTLCKQTMEVSEVSSPRMSA